MTSSSAIVVVMIFVVFTAALLTAREGVPRADVKANLEDMELPPAPVAVKADIPRATPQPAEAAKTVVARASTSPAPLPQAQTDAAVTSMNEAIEPEREKTASVTVSGCLEHDEGSFLLTDTAGTNAPTSRSWKSGFLKKRPAHIELADGVGTLNLRNHVGRRVAATGTLVEREMRVDSVRVVGACE
jgi:hypothetical protein